ncbi:MAG: hypothetical protein K8R58_15380 [Bacteroidales bacterium]|nr:hypothetical protein [Bacteroidales bacterium]
MHTIEPHYTWQHLYIASEDKLSPFYDNEYNEFEFTHAIYNYVIHPQWDEMGSSTLYVKILYVNYELGFCIIELFGEWNDCLHNDIMYLKRNIIEILCQNGINKYILIGENVLNFHSSSDNDYYQEWFEDVEEGWIAGINFRSHVLEEFENANIDYYIAFGGNLNNIIWRSSLPIHFFEKVNSFITKRLTV